jgi:hypothetical protein
MVTGLATLAAVLDEVQEVSASTEVRAAQKATPSVLTGMIEVLQLLKLVPPHESLRRPSACRPHITLIRHRS